MEHKSLFLISKNPVGTNTEWPFPLQNSLSTVIHNPISKKTKKQKPEDNQSQNKL